MPSDLGLTKYSSQAVLKGFHTTIRVNFVKQLGYDHY